MGVLVNPFIFGIPTPATKALIGWSGTNFLRRTAAVYTTLPLTLACWVRLTALPTGGGTITYFGMYASAAFDAYSLGYTDGDTGPYASARQGLSPEGKAKATALPTAGQWFLHVGVFNSTGSRSSFIAGTNKGTNTTSATVGALNRTSVGKFDGSSSLNPLAATDLVAHPAIWDIALSDADVAALAVAGTLPTAVQGADLVAYWPFAAVANPQPDSIGANTLAVQGSLSLGTGPF